MRTWLGIFAMLAMLMTTAVALVGPAAAEPGAPDTALTPDRLGVLAGSPTAPVQLELFCDPQCPDCAKFEAASGPDIARQLGDGQLAVTYRWLTFLDDRRHNDTSARVGNALMLAGDPATSATVYQAFVADLYRNQHPRGDGPTATDIARMARDSGVPEHLIERIESGQPGVDTVAMNAFNRARLTQVNPEDPGTPTVYHLNTNPVVDTDDPGWLNRLTHAG